MKRTDLEDLDLASLLQPGQTLGEQIQGEPGGIMDRFGYSVHRIDSKGMPEDQSEVAIVIGQRRSTEVLHVIGKAVMNITTLFGEGELVVHRADGNQQMHRLQPGRESVEVGPGDTYQYLHTGGWISDPLVVLDRSNYRPGDEISLEEVAIEGSLQLNSGLLVWSRWDPEKRHLAGAWLLDVEDYHDTTQYNLERAGQRGFRGAPSHWHATVQRVGESTTIPVGVELVDETFGMYPRGRSRAEIEAGEAPQPIRTRKNPKVFRKITDPA